MNLLVLVLFAISEGFSIEGFKRSSAEGMNRKERWEKSQEIRRRATEGKIARRAEGQPEGLTALDPRAFRGLTLVAPVRDRNVYFIDYAGGVVKTLETSSKPALSVYLSREGGVLKTAISAKKQEFDFRAGGGGGGAIEKYDRSGDLVWKFEYVSEDHCLHHDLYEMENGNFLAIAWVRVSREEAAAAGRVPEGLWDQGIWYTRIVEIQPTLPNDGKIVWSWDAWDHIIQDEYEDKPNFGAAWKHPHKINLNYFRIPVQNHRMEAIAKRAASENGEEAKVVSARIGEVDWLHANSIDYDERTGLVLLSVHGFDEFWVIDKNRPDDGIVYRFGNPRAYGAGEESDQFLYRQHDVQWIREGLPGCGNVLIFNNGFAHSPHAYSSVVELSLPEYRKINEKGDGRGFAPPKMEWSYNGGEDNPMSMHSQRMSSAQRLPNGNTLICEGPKGRIFQVTQDGKTVWEYWSPFGPLGPESLSPRHAQSVRPIFKARVYDVSAISE